jgi:transcriptional antiterminator RfaH
MSNAGSDSWIVARIHPHKEQLALDNLTRQGFHPYCPRIRRRIRHARRLQSVLRPLFPGYVFIRLNPEQEQWRSIASTFGVRNLIRFGERPGTVPDQFVTGLRSTEEGGAVTIPRARDSYEVGEKIRMREGPFEGLIATVLSATDSERIVVLMDLLRRSVRVRVPINEVVPA